MDESASNFVAVTLPLSAYSCVAQHLPHRDLAALRLVSKAWYHAANQAVRQFGSTDGFWTDVQLKYLRLAVTKFPHVSTLNLTFLPLNRSTEPLQILSLLSSLRNLQLYYEAAESSAGWSLLQQQTALTSLRVACLEYGAEAGIQDQSLLRTASLQSLVTLDLPLSSLATADGVSNLSKLTNLQSLRLPVDKYEAGVGSSSLAVFTGLSQLTFLSLYGWPIVDHDVVCLTGLKELRHVDFSMCIRLSCLCLMPLLEFPNLHTLQMVRNEAWLPEVFACMFERLRPSVTFEL